MEVKNHLLYGLPHPKIACLPVADTNIVTFAWAMPVDDEAKVLPYPCGRATNSYELSERRRELVLCIPAAEMLREVCFCGMMGERKVNKVEELGIQMENDVKIKAHHIKGCAAFLECRVMDSAPHKQFGEHAVYFAECYTHGPMTNSLIEHEKKMPTFCFMLEVDFSQPRRDF